MSQERPGTGAPAGEGPIVVVNAPLPDRGPEEPVTFWQPGEMAWRRILPEMGEVSPKLAVVRRDARTGGVTLLIWTPPGFHVPRHWHSGGEKHVVVRGTFVMECDGGGPRVVMRPGTFNYMPARQVHQAWTTDEEDCLLYTDVDCAWDINWVDPPPGADR